VEADGFGVADQFLQVGPLQGIAAGEDHDGGAHVFDPVQKTASLGGVEFGGIPRVDGVRPAVAAGQGAGAGAFPDHQQRGAVEIDREGRAACRVSAVDGADHAVSL
jgi:hypothetical protein